MNMYLAALHLTKREVFENAMRRFQFRREESLLVIHDGKMWLFERKDNSVSIRPIHGFVVGLVQEDWNPDGKAGKYTRHTRYVAQISWKSGGEPTGKWFSHEVDSTISTAYVFWEMKNLNTFLDNFEDDFFKLKQGKEIFLVPVTVELGKIS
jgi:hypothetical protein